MKGPRNLARDLCLIGVGSGEMKAMFNKNLSGVHVQERLEFGEAEVKEVPWEADVLIQE